MRALLAPRRELVLMWALGSLVMVVVLAIRETDWMTVWPRASAIADEGVMFAAPVLAGTACLVTQRRRLARPGSLLSSTPRSAVVRRLAEVLRLVVVATAVAGTGHAVAWGIALVREAAGTPVWRYALLSATTLVVMTVLGHAVGRVLHLKVASVGVALGVFVLIVLWPSTDAMMFWFVLNGWPQLTVPPGVLTGRVVLCLVVVLACALMTRTALWRSWAALMAVAATGMVVAMIAPPVALRDPYGQVCTEGDIVVCLWPDNGRVLPDAVEAAEVVRRAVAGTVPLPAAPLLEEGLAPAVSTGSIDATTSAAVTVRLGRGGLAESILSAWFDQFPSCPRTGSWETADYDALGLWQYWAMQRIDTVLDTGTGGRTNEEELLAELDAVLTLPESEQIAWAAEQAVRAQGCTA